MAIRAGIVKRSTATAYQTFTLNFAGATSAVDMSSDGDATFGAFTLTTANSGKAAASNPRIVAETSGGAGDGYLQIASDNVSNWFNGNLTAVNVEIDLTSMLDETPRPGDRVAVYIKHNQPAFAHANNPAWSLEVDTGLEPDDADGSGATRDAVSLRTLWNGSEYRSKLWKINSGNGAAANRDHVASSVGIVKSWGASATDVDDELWIETALGHGRLAWGAATFDGATAESYAGGWKVRVRIAVMSVSGGDIDLRISSLVVKVYQDRTAH